MEKQIKQWSDYCSWTKDYTWAVMSQDLDNFDVIDNRDEFLDIQGRPQVKTIFGLLETVLIFGGEHYD